MRLRVGLFCFVVWFCGSSHAEEIDDHGTINRIASELESKVISWRRDIHAHPELGNREFRTATLVGDHLERLGFDEVQRNIAHTGVVGVLKGGHPGRVVALRADMDALPVTEKTLLPFASSVKTTYNGQEVGVMHACGHDAHVAILMGVAELLVRMRAEIPGTVKFIFQPAEEGPPEGEEGGAKMMVSQGVLRDPRPDAIFGLHIGTRDLNTVHYSKGPMHASSDVLRITIKGKQTHGASPWRGVDPIVAASQIIMGLQTIHSRQIDTREAVVISIGSIHGGIRHNIIPELVKLVGTIRTHDPKIREDVKQRIERLVTHVGASTGAVATVSYGEGIPVNINSASLVESMLPTLKKIVGKDFVRQQAPVMGYEDIAYFQERVPGMFVFLGARPSGLTIDEAPSNHSPYFDIDEAALRTGVRVLAGLSLEFLKKGSEK
jgi:amidohydrolase